MTEIVLRDIDPLLADRIRRVADAHRWTLPQTLHHLLEQGLFAVESDLNVRFDDSDANALQAAIAALEQVPSDPGFAMIGRHASSSPGSPEPDQSVDASFSTSGFAPSQKTG